MKTGMIRALGAVAMAWMGLAGGASAQEAADGTSARHERLRRERIDNLDARRRSDDTRLLYEMQRRNQINREERRLRPSAPGMRSQPANGANQGSSVVRTE